MNDSNLIAGLYKFLLKNIPENAFDIIEKNDCRVENFFAVFSALYFEELKQNKKIKSCTMQNLINNQGKRFHIDYSFVDNNNVTTYLEFKHFSISQQRGKTRSLKFYTNPNGGNVGIVSDLNKFNTLFKDNAIDKGSNLVCIAFVTPKPDISSYKESSGHVKELGWEITVPIPLEEQDDKFCILIFEKSKSLPSSQVENTGITQSSNPMRVNRESEINAGGQGSFIFSVAQNESIQDKILKIPNMPQSCSIECRSTTNPNIIVYPKERGDGPRKTRIIYEYFSNQDTHRGGIPRWQVLQEEMRTNQIKEITVTIQAI